MNKMQFDKLIKPLVGIYDDIELDLIKNIIAKVDNYNEVNGSLKWYLEKLVDLGTIDKETLNVFKRNKKKIKETLKMIVTTAGIHIDDLDKLNDYFENGLINVNPKDLYKSNAINNLIKEALKDSESIIDLINTKTLEATKENYRAILNKAYVETSSGIYTYTESIRRALNEMAKEGITIANYESGKHFSIESVVRRDVITRVNKLVGDCEIEHAKELDTNLVYVDQHLGARVRTKYMKKDYEAHAEWQGKKYMIDGFNDEYPNLYEVTGYGEMLGLKGINCYHNMRPTWTWENIPDRIDEVENADKYEQYQQQRTFERKIRSLKREKLVAKELDNKDDLKSINKRFKNVNQKFDSWLKENNLTRDYNREYIAIESKTDIILHDITNNLKIKNQTNNLLKNTWNIIDDKFFNRIIGVNVRRKNIDGSYFDENKNLIVLGNNADEYVFIHELGHKLQTTFTKAEQGEYNELISAKFSKYSKDDFQKIKSKESGSYYSLKNYDGFVSRYQTRLYKPLQSFRKGRVNTDFALEYFSEGIKFYYKNPLLLKNKDKSLYDFIERMVKDER